MRRRLALVLVCTALVAGCGGGEPAGPPSDALGQMSVAFSTYPDRSEVKTKVDAALVATGTSISEDSYSRAGSVLVTMRKSNGADEMRTLDCIPAHANDPRAQGGDFAAVAALCSLIVTGALPS